MGEVTGARADRGLRVLNGARKLLITLANGAQLVGNVESGEDGYAKRVDGVAVGGDSAHLGVYDLSETLNVGVVGAAEVVDLVVDFDGDGLGF